MKRCHLYTIFVALVFFFYKILCNIFSCGVIAIRYYL